jgi:hypothetical protein
MEPIQRIDVDPTQRVEFLNRRRIRLKNADPSGAHFLFERTHDRREEIFLRTDQAMDGADAKARCGRDVPDRGDFVASATEFRPCHPTDVGRFVIGIGFALITPCPDDFVCGCERARAIQLCIAVWPAREPLQQDAAEDLGHPIGGRLVPNDVEPDMQHRLTHAVCRAWEIDIGSDVAAPLAGAQRLQHRLLNPERAPLGQSASSGCPLGAS